MAGSAPKNHVFCKAVPLVKARFPDEWDSAYEQRQLNSFKEGWLHEWGCLCQRVASFFPSFAALVSDEVSVCSTNGGFVGGLRW